MDIGYDRPLYILPFDHRASFEKGLIGFSTPLTAEQTATVAASKQVIYDGLKLALTKDVPREAAGILVDEQYGAAILRDARANGLITCAPAEKSGQEEFQFEYGDGYAQHIADFKPTFVKVLVRYNPESDEAMNRRQAARLRELADYVHKNDQHFMFELLVPMTHEQSDRLEGDQQLYDHDLRPSLMIAAIKELQNAGVEPDVWKIEGLDRRDDCAAARRTRQGGLHHPRPRLQRSRHHHLAARSCAGAGVHRFRRRPHLVLGRAGRAARQQDDAREGGRDYRQPLRRVGAYLRGRAQGLTVAAKRVRGS
jgi:myo-inositol catabolism protein IolC